MNGLIVNSVSNLIKRVEEGAAGEEGTFSLDPRHELNQLTI